MKRIVNVFAAAVFVAVLGASARAEYRSIPVIRPSLRPATLGASRAAAGLRAGAVRPLIAVPGLVSPKSAGAAGAESRQVSAGQVALQLQPSSSNDWYEYELRAGRIFD